ncbi:hypothetical protein FB451DRAFT_1532430 [Mycena latifolia]|nr:hypothetical protein FB451DRAFT_1532430 [Mycena latifolia]
MRYISVTQRTPNPVTALGSNLDPIRQSPLSDLFSLDSHHDARPRRTALLHRRTDAFIARLSEAVAFPISGDPAFRPAVHKMSDWLAAQLRAVGVEVKQVDLGTHVMDGQTLP